MLPHTRIAISLYCLVAIYSGQSVFSFPHADDTETVLVEEVVRYTDAGKNTTATLITLNEPATEEEEVDAAVVAHPAPNNAADESLIDAAVADDLIFLAIKPQQQQQQKKQQKQQQHQPQHETYHQIDLLTSDEEDSLTSASASAEQTHSDADADEDDGGVPREIELRTDLSGRRSNGRRLPLAGTTPPIDMSDFVALIPAVEVKSIADNYFRNDPEVQRAYAFLSSRDFAVLKNHIVAIPEMSTFLRYLNSSGLDVVGFLYTLTNLTSKATTAATVSVPNGNGVVTASSEAGNEIEKIRHSSTAEAAAAAPETTTTTKEQLNGLHGLVDSILDILPQDQILTTFFDKLETSEQFSKLVDSIGSPVFAKILNNMENSVPLRNLIFTLHNNGIYITRIVDSLKAYFFLAAF